MKLHGTSKINSEGILEIGGCNAIELVEKYGTPLWVMDEELIRNTCQRLVKAFSQKGNSQVLYASKAFLTTAMCKIINEEGLGLDVVSGGELYTALKANFPVKNIYFHGNNKGFEEIKLALENGIGRIVVDNFYELQVLNGIAGEMDTKQAIILRITPGVEAHTHEYIRTGQIDSKFGFTLTNGQAMEAVKIALELPNLDLKGIHCHIGSQIFEMGSYGHAAHVMIEFMKNIEKETGYVIEELNIGGGLGIYYSKGDEPSSIENYAEVVMSTVKEKCNQFSLPVPKLLIEPGRSIAGPAGTTLYKVGSIKDIPDVRKYVAVDGGMYENLRPALYEAKYEVYVANRMNDTNTEKVTVTGKCCESGDILAWNIRLPELNPGDILAMTTTGAYGYAMSGNYNRIPKQAVVLVYNGKSDEIVKKETYEDLIRNDVLPERLK
ncbi:MAG: diaminopimelate decarboxylase [Desulfitibacter sp. BRH_c19]|nr:MAG: diaminopimelate decarboxylase [Desulfitibacter sp. BRH_c19]